MTSTIETTQPGRVQPCWCGERNPAFLNVLSKSCGGSGTLDCICGGDFCVCHNHGEVECDGCSDCELDDSDIGEGEDWR